MGPKDKPEHDSGARWSWQFAVVVALLLGFAVLVAILFNSAGGSEIIWQRRVYLFGAVEAVVFTAVGWLFGREVHRAAAESAKKDATEAKQEAAGARDEAKSQAKQAAAAELKAAEEQVKGRAVQAAMNSVAASSGRSSRGPSDAGFGQAAPSGTAESFDMKAFVNDLYGPGSAP